jgi:hypothetical protein
MVRLQYSDEINDLCGKIAHKEKAKYKIYYTIQSSKKNLYKILGSKIL